MIFTSPAIISLNSTHASHADYISVIAMALCLGVAIPLLLALSGSKKKMRQSHRSLIFALMYLSYLAPFSAYDFFLNPYIVNTYLDIYGGNNFGTIGNVLFALPRGIFTLITVLAFCIDFLWISKRCPEKVDRKFHVCCVTLLSLMYLFLVLGCYWPYLRAS